LRVVRMRVEHLLGGDSLVLLEAKRVPSSGVQ
jgi:hypothetical protein